VVARKEEKKKKKKRKKWKKPPISAHVAYPADNMECLITMTTPLFIFFLPKRGNFFSFIGSFQGERKKQFKPPPLAGHHDNQEIPKISSETLFSYPPLIATVI